MSMLNSLPEMADDRLKNLHDNAARLVDSGSAAERRNAAELLPVIEAEVEARRVARQERLKEARLAAAKTAKPARVRKPAAKKAAKPTKVTKKSKAEAAPEEV